MDPETAQIVLIAITAIGVVVWLTILQFLTGSHRAVRQGRPTNLSSPICRPRRRRTGWRAVPRWMAGERICGQGCVGLGERNLLTFGPIKMVEKTDDYIAFEHLGTGNQALQGYSPDHFRLNSA